MPKPQNRKQLAGGAKRNGQLVKKPKPQAKRRVPPAKPVPPARRNAGAAAGRRLPPAKPAPPTREILLAGSGGQGVILTGKMLAQAAVSEGFNATYIPSYGAEVRGGTAHCHVKMGHRPIGSPIVEDATVVVAMNEPSYRAFSPLLRRGSTLVVNTSLVPSVGKHPGVKIVSLELTKIAAEMGSLRSANMLVFGLCAGLLGLNDTERLKAILGGTLGKKNPAMLEVNERILAKGIELGQTAVAGG
jgi:2-oxoglutarate ferredoxin oxidoreductase subunit gamma